MHLTILFLLLGNPALAIYKNNVAIGQQYDTSEGSKLQVNGDISLTNRANRININGHKGILKHWTNDTQICANDGTIYLRPKGDENTTNQVMVNNDGSITASNLKGASTQVLDYGDTTRKISIGYAGDGLTYSTVTHIAGYTDYGSKIKDINKTELQKWLRPTSLYDNSSGTTGTVTLSETAANFSYIELFLTKDSSSGIWNVRVQSPNGKNVQVGTTYNHGSGTQSIGKKVTISGTSITQGEERYVNISSGTTGSVKMLESKKQ